MSVLWMFARNHVGVMCLCLVNMLPSRPMSPERAWHAAPKKKKKNCTSNICSEEKEGIHCQGKAPNGCPVTGGSAGGGLGLFCSTHCFDLFCSRWVCEKWASLYTCCIYGSLWALCQTMGAGFSNSVFRQAELSEWSYVAKYRASFRRMDTCRVCREVCL